MTDIQYKILIQQGYSSTKYSVSRNVPVKKYSASSDVSVPNIQSVGTFHCRKSSQSGYSSTKCSVSRDVPVQNIPSVGIFQYMHIHTYLCRRKLGLKIGNLLLKARAFAGNLKVGRLTLCEKNEFSKKKSSTVRTSFRKKQASLTFGFWWW
jgi:hypothetical protein